MRRWLLSRTSAASRASASRRWEARSASGGARDVVATLQYQRTPAPDESDAEPPVVEPWPNDTEGFTVTFGLGSSRGGIAFVASSIAAFKQTAVAGKDSEAYM